MPLLREKANYKTNDRTPLSDMKVIEYGYEKTLKEDRKRMTGGIQIVICTCSRKLIYSLKKYDMQITYIYSRFHANKSRAILQSNIGF